MGDARLNSIHLEGSRRQLFRSARENLLQARGQETLFGEKLERDSGDYPHTIIQAKDLQESQTPDNWLQDQENLIYPLKIGLNTIGRSDDNDVVVPDAYVSRRHCAILVHATTGCELHDIASKNGTFINGDKLCGPTRLKSGDEIRMCGRNFIFHSRDEAGSEHANNKTLSA
jgi:pSer/pThr/pTyr-binding forkhead associated (FHA) protein